MQSPTVDTLLSITSTTSDVLFDEISQRLGCKPQTIRYLDHALRSGRAAPVRVSEWLHGTGEQTVDSLDDGIHILTSILDQRWPELANVVADMGYTVQVVSVVRVRDWTDRPFTGLSRLSIDKLHLAQASWSLDWVDLSR